MSQQLTPARPPQSGGTPLTLGRIWRITRKELRETLRDRRTIITLLLMPLLVYPILSLAFRQFLLSSYNKQVDVTWSVGVYHESDYPLIDTVLSQGDLILKGRDPKEALKSVRREYATSDNPRDARPLTIDWVMPHPPNSPEQALSNKDIDLVVQPKRDANNVVVYPLECEILYRTDMLSSTEALRFFEQRIRAFNQYAFETRLKNAGEDAAPAVHFNIKQINEDAPVVLPVETLIPLILILMTITGAVYPAIDLTAGERERGTLESLIASPMPRFALLIGKYIAVLTVAVLTAVMNTLAMTITLYSTGLSGIMFRHEGLSPLSILAVFGLMVLFAAFFSAVLLTITSFARSFKEAQAYLIPLMLVSMTPGFLSTVPSIKFEGWWAVTPLANMVLLARDVLKDGADPTWTIIALASTIIYALTALVIAAQIFGNDSILYGSQETWEDWLWRPKHPSAACPREWGFFTKAIIFPLFIWLSGQVALWQTLTMKERLLGNVAITALLFVGIPAAVMWWRRVNLISGFQLFGFHPLALLGAVFIGGSMFPIAFELVQFSERIGLARPLMERSEQVLEMAKELAKQPLGLQIFCMAIAPAVCEELYFRGFFFSSLRSREVRGVTVIFLSAIFFGLFHVLTGTGLQVERLFSTTAIGCVLAWITLRSGSVIPSMAAHAIHNSIPFLLMRFADRIPGMNAEVGEMRSVPWQWHVGATIGLVIGGFLLWWSTENRDEGAKGPKGEES